jgi:hypothetical protein
MEDATGLTTEPGSVIWHSGRMSQMCSDNGDRGMESVRSAEHTKVESVHMKKRRNDIWQGITSGDTIAASDDKSCQKP